jgi:predicted ABC-type ATPase
MPAPQLWVVAGPNGAEKTTLVGKRVARRIPVINPDEIAAGLPRIDGHLDKRNADR